MDKIRETITFFASSAKRHALLREITESAANVDQVQVTSKRKALKSLNPTRCVERHDSIITFLEMLHEIEAALDTIANNWTSKDSRQTASCLLAGVREFSFIGTLHALEKVSAIMVITSRLLQAQSQDIIKALADIKQVTACMEDLRAHAEESFHEIFCRALSVAKELGVVAVTPRSASRSIYKPSAWTRDGITVEEYYRINMYAPLLDGILTHLRDRFGPTQEKCLTLGYLIPASLGTFEQLEPALHTYSAFLEGRVIVEQEFKRWSNRWGQDDSAATTNTALAALDQCCSMTLPNIHTLLSILATLPVTTAEAERVFSKVERCASAVRASMGEERLAALVLLETHRDRPLNPHGILDRFANRSARRLNLLL